MKFTLLLQLDELELSDVAFTCNFEDIELDPCPHIRAFLPEHMDLIIGKGVDLAYALDDEQIAYALWVINEELNTPNVIQKLVEMAG
jgi:hypothetical protein